jgi:hypothetical protein
MAATNCSGTTLTISDSRQIDSGWYYGGGGGRIAIYIVNPQPVTIKKTLESVERLGAGDNGDGDGNPNDNFNPYALQKGDKINVVLEITNAIPGALTIEDEMLMVPYSNPKAYCKYNIVPVGQFSSFWIRGNDPVLGYNEFGSPAAHNPSVVDMTSSNPYIAHTITIPSGWTAPITFSYWCTVQ